MGEQRLFKYMRYRKGFLKNLLLAVPRNHQLNDPFESNPSEGIRLQILNEKRAKDELLPYASLHEAKPIAEPYYYKSRTNAYSNYGSISFTRNHRNNLMWSHYADEHQGIVLELDQTHEFFKSAFESSNPKVGKLVDVDYQEERPSKLDKAFDLIFTKGFDWKYEEELRMVIPKQQCSFYLNPKTKRIKKVGPETFDTPKFVEEHQLYFVKLPPEAIKCIYVGARMQFEAIKEIAQKIEFSNSLRHIKLYEFRLHPNKFSLEIHPSYAPFYVK